MFFGGLMNKILLKISILKYKEDINDLVFAFKRYDRITKLTIYREYNSKDNLFILVINDIKLLSKVIRNIYRFFCGTKIILSAREFKNEISFFSSKLNNLYEISEAYDIHNLAYTAKCNFYFESESESLNETLNSIYPILILQYSSWKDIYWHAIEEYEKNGSLSKVVSANPEIFPYRSKVQRYLDVSRYYEVSKLESFVNYFIINFIK